MHEENANAMEAGFISFWLLYSSDRRKYERLQLRVAASWTTLATCAPCTMRVRTQRGRTEKSSAARECPNGLYLTRRGVCASTRRTSRGRWTIKSSPGLSNDMDLFIFNIKRSQKMSHCNKRNYGVCFCMFYLCFSR